MAQERRIQRLEVLLREIISGILVRELHFPEGALVTVTRAEISEDLFHADVFISVLGSVEQEKDVLGVLARSAGEIQHILNRKLRMRPVPRITFAIDQDEKRRERVEKLLSEGEGRV